MNKIQICYNNANTHSTRVSTDLLTVTYENSGENFGKVKNHKVSKIVIGHITPTLLH